MSQSKWKIKHDFSTNHKLFFSKSVNILKRNKILLESFLNKSIKVYNGKDYKAFKITRERLGFKTGEFFFTRALRKKIKKNPKKSKKKIK